MFIFELNWRLPTTADWYDTFQILAGDDPLDITGASIVLKLASINADGTLGSTVHSLTVGDGITLIEPTKGVLEISRPASVVAGLGPGRYQHDMRMTIAGHVLPLSGGLLEIYPGVP